jgi:HAD superfamily hydrolase (TIGR01549 family)
MRRCVLVDLGGTLIYGPSIREVFDEALQSDEIRSRLDDSSIAKLRGSFREVYEGLKAIKRGLLIEVGLDTTIRLALKEVSITDGQLMKDLKEVLLKLYVQERKAYDDARPFLEELKGSGFVVVVVSNIPEHDMAVDSLDRLGLSDYVDEVVTSARLGLRKPHPLVYLRALEKARASNAVFVGDSVENDVLGPLNVGIPAIHVARSGVTLKRSVSSLSDALDIILTGCFAVNV